MAKNSLLSVVRAFVLVAPLGLSCSIATAQTTGTIYGQISDPSGAAINGASIKAMNVGTGLVREAISNAEGSYQVPAVPPGSYSFTVEHPGFKTFTQTGITVTVGANARVDAPLQVGTVNETVKVSGNAVGVDAQSSTIGTTVDNQRIQDMPLNGRNVLALTQLLPGVGYANLPIIETVGRAGPPLSVSGSRMNQNNIELDGTSMIEQFLNLGTNLPSPDSIQEFRVLTNTFDAQYGRASGGVLLAITKSSA
jgi:hypothetical protein